MIRLCMAHKKPNGSTMCLGKFDIEDAQACLGEDALSGNQRQIGKMLMIDGVKLMQLHQLKEMLHFEGSDALRGEQYSYAGHEIVDVRYMRQHIIAGDQIRGPTLTDQFMCILPAQKLNAPVDALFHARPPATTPALS